MIRLPILAVVAPLLAVACTKPDQAKPAENAAVAAAPQAEAEAAKPAPVEPHFDSALAAITAGKSPAKRDTKPYGCSVKYAEGTESTAVEAELGQPAPDFELSDLAGNPVKLSSFRGKTVVLEWYNPECPFVEYAYNEGPLKELAKQRQGDTVVWLNINSGAEGKQGAGKELNEKYVAQYGIEHPVLLDPTGEVGRKYGAKTTPHMYIVDAEGNLVYRGGLDNAPFGKVES